MVSPGPIGDILMSRGRTSKAVLTAEQQLVFLVHLLLAGGHGTVLQWCGVRPTVAACGRGAHGRGPAPRSLGGLGTLLIAVAAV